MFMGLLELESLGFGGVGIGWTCCQSRWYSIFISVCVSECGVCCMYGQMFRFPSSLNKVERLLTFCYLLNSRRQYSTLVTGS
jgi:hypothetical protein